MNGATHPFSKVTGGTGKPDAPTDKSVLTYSALNTFRNCPRKYKHRYVDCLRPRERPEALSFGSVIHGAIERWYQSAADANRLWTILDFLDQQFPDRVGDEAKKAAWNLARAMITGYAARCGDLLRRVQKAPRNTSTSTGNGALPLARC